eukprot:TRINITY_DN723_c0_g1_i1.p1 TRINITY_DN723_c0_g1~~TRINITY_DN723_c0_g1_i1.p1  ORF type:complete len:431 (-),score=138.56 TRINITY_DN723_c0_g1_i1:154-1446(-)
MIVQQSGTGLGIVGDGKGWSGGATRSDGEANQSQRIKENRPKVWLEVELSKRKLGRITLELFGDIAPRTVENFRCLCTGERGVGAVSGKPLHYKGSIFHKIIPGKYLVGGDTTKGNGQGGESIYNQDGDGTFPDENFKHKHDRPGLISMAHKGGEEGLNCSQFFFTTKPQPKLDGKNCVFGRIITGMDLLTKIESVGSQSGKPQFEVVIVDCGEMESEAMKKRKRKEGDDPLPPGWQKKESRSKPGLFYYVHEGGYTQFERPSSRCKDPLTAMAEVAKRRRQEVEDGKKLTERACSSSEVRVWHILKKHKDFFGKSGSSWRQKNITWSKKEAKVYLEKMRDKLFNVAYGGGMQGLKKKFENLARQESDDEVSAKMGGDLGPVTKKAKLFGGYQIVNCGFKLEVKGEDATVALSREIIETDAGCHLVARFE